MPQVHFDTRIWTGSAATAPFITIRHGDTTPQIAGTKEAFVGHRYHTSEDARPRGIWGQWRWDGQMLTAEVDPLGYCSLFVYAKGDNIAISPSLLQLLAQGADPQPDPVALAVFHRIGFFVGDDTPFRHIRVLPPGGRLIWRAGRLTVESHRPKPKLSRLTRAQAVEAFVELPRQSVRRFLSAWDGPIAMPLSGGRDSRHILLEMVAQGRKPDTCVTFHHGGTAQNAEVKAARAVAARAGVRHTILGHPRGRLRDCLRALLLTQLCADEHGQMMPMHDYFSGSAAAAVDGIGGDILTNPDNSAAGFMQHALRGDFGAIAREMAEGHGKVISRRGHSGGAGRLYSPDLDEAATARIVAEIEACADAPDPYQAFWFWHRTRREISFVSTGILGGARMVFCPYLDPDFVELGLSLPWSVTCDQMLHDDAIAGAYPAYANIPFAEGFRPDPPPRLRPGRLGRAWDMARIAAMSDPGGPLRGLSDMLAPTGLTRGPADIYRLHGAFVAGMDAERATRLMAMADRLSDAAPKGQATVSEVYDGA